MVVVRNMAIKHKLISLVMLTCVAALLLVGTTFVWWQRDSLRQGIRSAISIQAEMTADNCKASLAFDDSQDAAETLKALKAEPSIVLAVVYKKDGQTFASYSRTNIAIPPLPAEIPADGHDIDDSYLTIFKPIVLDKETIGTVCLRSDLSPMYEALTHNAENVIGVLLLASLAAYFISSRLQRIISGPILTLADVARQVSEKKDYSARASKQSNDEVGLLIDSFNDMLEQIQQRDSELVKTKGQLEIRVEERTKELTATNDQLTGEIQEREKAERKQAELLKELENVNQELKDFAYIASHDLKAPLRAIKTLAEWISTDYADKLDADGKEQLKLLQSRVDRMHNLIDGILQYSRVGRVRDKIVDIDLNKLVPEIIDILAPPAHISITAEGELPNIKCEETRITQIFQNLLSNAIKYTDKPQGIIKIACCQEGEFWKFSVADNGPGIEKQHWERIFKIFQTLAPRDEYESTGIGLTVVKKIIELYGGRIWLDSEVGKGTTFFFTLPRAGIEESAAEEEAVSVSASENDGSDEQETNGAQPS